LRRRLQGRGLAEARSAPVRPEADRAGGPRRRGHRDPRVQAAAAVLERVRADERGRRRSRVLCGCLGCCEEAWAAAARTLNRSGVTARALYRTAVRPV